MSSLNDELGAEGELLVQVEEELLHGRVALDEHALGHVNHDGGMRAAVGGKGESRALFAARVRVGGDEVVEDDQEKEGDAEHVGEHGELRVGDHFGFDLTAGRRGNTVCYYVAKAQQTTKFSQPFTILLKNNRVKTI